MSRRNSSIHKVTTAQEGAPAQSILPFTAAEKLGLKLEAGKGPRQLPDIRFRGKTLGELMDRSGRTTANRLLAASSAALGRRIPLPDCPPSPPRRHCYGFRKRFLIVATAGNSSAAPSPAVWKDGTWSGLGSCRHGDIQVSVIVKGGRIQSAAISKCLTRYSCHVISQLPPEVAQRQNPDKLDVVTGATESSNAFYYAVVDALKHAK